MTTNGMADFTGLSIAELQARRVQIDEAIARNEARRLGAAKAVVSKVLGDYEVTIQDLFPEAFLKTASNGGGARNGGGVVASAPGGRRPPGSKKKLPAKFVNRDDTSQTWVGRGRKPNWMNQGKGVRL